MAPNQLLLGEMVRSVREREEGRQGEPAGTNDVLVVPRISLDIVRRYRELENHWLVPPGPKASPDLFLLSAMQGIKFEMNEKGVELLSEVHMTFGCAAKLEPIRRHVMVFDKPFLVLLKRKTARVPYFALWVDNAEVLIPW